MDTTPEDITKVKEHIRLGKGKWGRIYARCKTDLRMCAGVEGAQFQEADKLVRGKNRATFSFPVLDKFVERVVGTYNSSPFGIGFEAASPDAKGPAAGLTGVIAGVEQLSNAQFAYRHALRNASTCGYGWLYVTTEYADEYGDSMDVQAQIMPVLNPTSIYLDPLSVAIDGRDAEWAIHSDVIGLDAAKAEFGDDVTDNGLGDSLQIVDAKSLTYAKTSDTLPVTTHFERVHKWREVWYAEDGSKSEKRTSTHTKSKRVKSTTVEVIKVVGNKVVSKQTLPIKCLPIVPVYGLPYWHNETIEYIGLVHRGIDAQRITNYAGSLGAERLALSPKSNFMGSARAVGNWIEQWKNSARDNNPLLVWDDLDKDGQPVTPPQQLNTSVDLSDTMGTITGMLSLISEVVGMPAQGFGDDGPRQQTAEEALLRNRSAESVNSTFYENLASSIERLGYVTAELVLQTYDTERDVLIVEPNGEAQKIRTNVQEKGIDLNSLNVRVTAGPLLSTQRKDNMRSYIALGQLLGPAYTPVLGPKVAECIDNADEDVIEGIKQISMMQLGAGQQQPQDPSEADALRAELAAAQQQLLEMKMANRDMEIKVVSDQALTEQKHQNAMELELLKLQGQAGLQEGKAQMDAAAQEAEDLRRLQADLIKQDAAPQAGIL